MLIHRSYSSMVANRDNQSSMWVSSESYIPSLTLNSIYNTRICVCLNDVVGYIHTGQVRPLNVGPNQLSDFRAKNVIS